MGFPGKRPEVNAAMTLPALATAAAPTYVEGDAVPLSVDLNGELRSSGTGAGSGGTAAADDADFTAGTTNGTPAMGVYQSIPSNVTDGDLGTVGITEDRRLKTSTTIEGGASVGTAGSASADVLSIQGVASMTPVIVTVGTSATSLGKAEDEAHTSGDVGVMMLGVRNDSAGTLSGTDGDYTPISVNSQGRLYIGDHIPGVQATRLGKAEDAAHASGDTGVYMLAVRDDAPAAHSGTDGDYESLHVSAEGALWTTLTPSANGGLSIYRSIDLDEGTLEVVKATPGTVYGMWVTNTATSTRWIKFYNATSGTAGTGTPVITIGVPGNSSDDISGSFGPGGVGIGFTTGICVGATTGVADADTGAPGASDLIVNIFFK